MQAWPFGPVQQPAETLARIPARVEHNPPLLPRPGAQQRCDALYHQADRLDNVLVSYLEIDLIEAGTDSKVILGDSIEGQPSGEPA